ncbi:hypothetical protein [Melissococcus sp. OM08-11BH]|uniref:hypothetical protein n=1 Tax=Melissococcus sp. OM08-11BH TaxID=2293110 RepID=UPI000E467218|nr:hypothetical protein [Melissococcus sp. OM08-11BH]RGI31966.1 hypothetical protein DXC12_01295 [Melissococcus sp. OM08-11BH]
MVTIFSKTKLVVGSVTLGVLGFSPMIMPLIGKGKKEEYLKINPKYYHDKDEPLFNNDSNK